MWHQGSVKSMVTWHGLRHLFVYPVHIDDPDDKESMREFKVEVKDPASFDFKVYLVEKMGDLFTEMIEVDTPTWITALVLVVPFVFIGIQVEAKTTMFMQFAVGVLTAYEFLRVI